MDPILPALAVSAVVLTGYAYVHRRVLYWQHIKRIANQHLPEVKLSIWGRGLVLQGQEGLLKVLIAGSPLNKGAQVRIVIPGPPGFSKVSIRREDQTPWKTREIEVGSESFDRTFFVAGPVPLVLALLDAKARRLLVSANDAATGAGSRLEIAGGELVAETGLHQLPLILPILLGIGEQLAQPVGLKWRLDWRLARNATRDPEAGVRLKNLLLLVRERPGDRRTLRVLHAACSDKSPEIRLQAGKALGAQGRSVLLELAESQEDDAVSAEAFSILSNELPFESTKAILLQALSRRSLQTARTCLESLGGRGGDASVVSALVKVMENEQGELAAFAAQALGTVGSPAPEESLILALQRDQEDLRMAAANALGRIGSSAAVLPLQEVAERSWLHRELRRTAHQAIAEIQSRLPGASPGQLSLAGAEAGQLSLAQAEAGQLSIATDQSGQISISDADNKPEEA